MITLAFNFATLSGQADVEINKEPEAFIIYVYMVRADGEQVTV